MKDAHQIAPYSLRISEDIKAKARKLAAENRRSLNAEIGLLIEDGLKWRESHAGRANA